MFNEYAGLIPMILFIIVCLFIINHCNKTNVKSVTSALANLSDDVTVSKYPTRAITKGLKSVHGITLINRLGSMRLIEGHMNLTLYRSLLLTCSDRNKYLHMFAIDVHRKKHTYHEHCTVNTTRLYGQYVIMHFAFKVPDAYLVIHPKALGDYGVRHLGEHRYKTGDSYFDSKYVVLTNDDTFAEYYMTKDRIAMLLETNSAVYINSGNLFVSRYFKKDNFLVLYKDSTIKESYAKLLDRAEKVKTVFCL